MGLRHPALDATMPAMPRVPPQVAALVVALVPSIAAAAPAVALPAGGGLEALEVAVDVAARSVRAASCKALPCPPGTPRTEIPIDAPGGPLDAARVEVSDVPLAAGRHLARVRIPIDPPGAPEGRAWQALLVAGAPPLFTGLTGWLRGEPGERSGTEVRVVEGEGHSTVVVGEVREDLRVCGDDSTLLDPRGLDAATLTFRGATLQRVSSARRDAALLLTATPLRGPAHATLVPLLSASGSTSPGGGGALTDGDITTVWSETRPGHGQGEFVVMRTPFDVPIDRFALTVAPPRPAADGAAPETLFLATNSATFEVTVPEDAWSRPGEAYEVTLPQPVRTSCVALVLADAYTRGRAHPVVSVAELAAYGPFDHPGATLDDVASHLIDGDASAEAAAAVLERAGAQGLAAAARRYSTLGPAGRALAVNIAASADSCEESAPILTQALADADDVVRSKALAKLEQPTCGRAALPALLGALRDGATRRRAAPVVALFGRERALTPLAEWLGVGDAAERAAMRSAVAFASRDAADSDVAGVIDGSRARSTEGQLDALRALAARLPTVHAAADASVAAAPRSRAACTSRTNDCAKCRAWASAGIPLDNEAANRSNAWSKWRSCPRALESSPKTTSRVAADLENARRTSRHMMLPEPSHIELTGISRTMRASGSSSV